MTTTSLRLPWPGNGYGEAIWMVMLLRAEDGEEEPKVCLVATEDNHPTEAKVMVLSLSPNEAGGVDVT